MLSRVYGIVGGIICVHRVGHVYIAAFELEIKVGWNVSYAWPFMPLLCYLNVVNGRKSKGGAAKISQNIS